MFSTYKPEDVTILLKDISGLVQPLPTAEREALIQQGVHYSEMLPLETQPSPAYLEAFFKALELYAPLTAEAVAVVAEKLLAVKGPDLVLVSLARAGTPIGILLKLYLKRRFGISVSHYTISIIRGRGIDKKAMAYILERHQPQHLQFVDGWTGKGAIQRELAAAMAEFPQVSPGLAVLSDPAGLAAEYGTRGDFLIASSCLEQDLTYHFIDSVAAHFPVEKPKIQEPPEAICSAAAELQGICRDFDIADINLVKPGIGEATRVLLRRLPWKILVHSLNDEEHLGHLYQLAREKNVQLQVYPLQNYRACGLIQNLADS